MSISHCRSKVSWTALIAAVLVCAGCVANQRINTDRSLCPARINHLAFFKLKNPSDASELIADCDNKLARIPRVVSYFCGRHLDTGRGERVDGNYDVGFYVGFVSEEDLSQYVKHPDHTALVEKWRPRWEWIRVHDVLDDSP
jgi:hypothetical protein